MEILLCLCGHVWEELSVGGLGEGTGDSYHSKPCLFVLGRHVIENVMVTSGLVYFMVISILVKEILGIFLT